MLMPPGHQALRRGRVSLPNQIYLLTTTTAYRRPLFDDPSKARIVCRCMVDATCWQHGKLLCWVLMPDHWHGLLQLDDDGDISATMNRWKAISTRHLHRQGHAGQVWTRGFHDHTIRCDENVVQAARYIVANPLRAKLVSDVLAYPYWDCIWYTPQSPP